MGYQAETLGKAKQMVERLDSTEVYAPCIGERIDVAGIEALQIALSELAASREFERDNRACGLCGEFRLTIRKRK